MARIIELSGSPGVGKSTLYKELIKRWNRKGNWIPAHFLYPREKSVLKNVMRISRFLIKKIKNETLTDLHAMEKSGDRFLQQNRKMVDTCFANILFRQQESLERMDRRFGRTTFLNKILQKVQTVREYETNKFAIVDEGLLYCIPNWIPNIYEKEDLLSEEEEINKLIRLMPLPEAMVYIDIDVEENIRRLVNRRKLIPTHYGLTLQRIEDLTRESHRVHAIINKQLALNGLTILHLDAKKEISTNVNDIIHFIETFKENTHTTKPKV